MRVQDLRDNDNEKKEFIFHKRGWTKHLNWEIVISRKRFQMHRLLSFQFGLIGHSLSNLSFTLLGLSVYLTPSKYDDCRGKQSGFYFCDSDFVIQWMRGDFTDDGYIKFIHYPWSYYYCEKEFMSKHGVMLKELPNKYGWEKQRSYQDDNIKKEVFDYTYILKNGTIQNRKATVTVDRMTWWWRLFGLGKYHLTPKKSMTSIWVEFDDEVGERTGSWKGGTMGCGYEMLPGETAEQTLRRMEKERKF